VEFELEVDPLHPVTATGMRACWFVVVDVGRCHGAETTLSIIPVKAFDLWAR